MSLFTKLVHKSIKDFFQRRKKLLILCAVIFTLLVGINFIVNHYVDKVVGTLIVEFVEEKSNGFYYVEFDELAYVLNNGRFLMTDFVFDVSPGHKDEFAYQELDQNYIYTASIPSLHIDIIDFWSIFIMRKLRVLGIEVREPEIKITNLNKNTAPKKISFEAGNFYQALSGHLSELKIKDFAIENARFHYRTVDAPDYDNFDIEGLTFRVRNFQLNANSSDRDDKIFYTDDIFLEVKNQELLLKDSIHQLSFGRFFISTSDNDLGFENLKLSKRDSTLINAEDRNHYEVFIPAINLTGVDFVSAYNDNFLLIDSINIKNPKINLTQRIKKHVDPSEKNSLLDLAMIYHDYLEVDHFNLEDGHLRYENERKSPAKSYSIDHISTMLTKIKIDSGTHSEHPYGFDFEEVKLSLRDYELSLPDSINSMSFKELSIESNPSTITLEAFEFKPGNAQVAANQKDELNISIPYLVITGLDIPKAINSDTLLVSEFNIHQPDIRMKSQAKPGTGKTQSAAGLFGLYGRINELFRLFSMDRFYVEDARINLEIDGKEKVITIDSLDLDIHNIKVDSIAAQKKNALGQAWISASLANSNFKFNKNKLALGSFQMNTRSKSLEFSDLIFANDSSSNTYLNVKLPRLQLSGLDLDQVIFSDKIDLSSIVLDQMQIEVDRRIIDNAAPQPKSEIQSYFPVINIERLQFRDYKVMYRQNGQTVFSGQKANLDISDLVLDQSLSDEPTNQFDFGFINEISVRDYNLFLTKQQHLLSADLINLYDNSALEIKNIHLMPYENPNNKYKINVPSVSLRGIDLKRLLKKSYYEGSEFVIEKPSIELHLAEGQQKNPASLDLGFIPVLLRNRFHGVSTSNFALNEGAMQIHQKTADDSLLLECDNLNIVVENFEVDSTTEMNPGKFLFARDVRINGDYLSAHYPEKRNFYHINHFDISTKEKDARFEGIYYASNADRIDKGKAETKARIDFLNILDLDFYKLTQNKTIELAEIDIANAEISITPASKKQTGEQKEDRTTQGLNIHKKAYAFDTAILKHVAIDRIFMTDSKFRLENPVEAKTDLIMPDLWLLAEGIEYNPLAASDSNRIFYSDQIMAKLSNFTYITPDNLASVRLNELILNSADSSMKINNFRLEPRVTKFDYGPAKGYQSTWMRINNDSIAIEKVDFLGIINRREFSAEKIGISNIDFEIYRDKRIHFPEWQRRPLPQTELKGINFTINIDTVNLSHAYVAYQEHAEKANTPGEIYFEDLHAKIINITNDIATINRNPYTNISATGEVFGKGFIDAEFQFDMKDPDNIHRYGIEVDSFDLTEFNRILIPNASAQIKSGNNERIIMTAHADENYSYGEMRFFYNDLKVQLLNRETETPKGLGNILGSFFANTFIIRSNNPKNFVLRKGDIYFERDEKRAIFNYWVKTFLSGVVSSIGAKNNKKKIRKMQEEKLKNPQLEETENLTLDK
jgi:hypothetical protein